MKLVSNPEREVTTNMSDEDNELDYQPLVLSEDEREALSKLLVSGDSLETLIKEWSVYKREIIRKGIEGDKPYYDYLLSEEEKEAASKILLKGDSLKVLKDELKTYMREILRKEREGDNNDELERFIDEIPSCRDILKYGKLFDIEQPECTVRSWLAFICLIVTISVVSYLGAYWLHSLY